MLDCAFRTSDCAVDPASCPHHLERLTAALAQRETQLLEFWQNARDIHNIVDEDGWFRRVSPACLDLLGYTPSMMEGRPFMDFVHPDDVEKTLQVWEGMRHKGMSAFAFRNRYRHADGSYVLIEWHASPLIGGRIYSTARPVGAKER